MSWIVDSTLTYFQNFCVKVIKCGPIPSHMAIIMDGNRRYATKANVQRAEGHLKGFDKLAETLQWCFELGITEVTVYAFSIENFKRSKEEVDTLMKLAIEKFERLLEEKDKLMKEQVCIRIIGNWSLLPQELRKLMAEAVLMTKDNKRAFLNVAFAYTSRDEITNAAKVITEGIQQGEIDSEDVDEHLISDCLYSCDSPDPDIIVRTSGEVRFSDFLLWQISDSFICFTEVLWPEFCIWHLLACIFMYQRCYKDLTKRVKNIRNDKVEKFVQRLHEKNLQTLKSYLG